MKCKECEEAIYTYRELSDSEKQRMEVHLQSCSACRKLFEEVMRVNSLVLKASRVAQAHSNPEWLTNKIMSGVISKPQPAKRGFSFLPGFFDVAATRYALAGVSICLLLLFFIETGNPLNEPNPVKSPIANLPAGKAGLQGVIVRSQDLQKNLNARKERKRSVLADCTSRLKRKIDLACLREKVKNLNF